MISEDNRQRLQSLVTLFATGYKMLMAGMLAVFVPQRCPESVNQECSMADNFTDLIPYNTAVLIVNLLTLAAYLTFYGVEYYRENWCIEYLDFDESKPVNGLEKEIETYPELKTQLMRVNLVYFYATVGVLALSVVNFVMSSVLVYHFYYLDYKSITVMITYAVLIADKLASSLSNSQRSYEQCLPYSAYRSGPLVYNVVDVDYKTVEMTKQVLTRT